MAEDPIAEALRKHLARLGKKGGERTRERLGPEHYAAIGRAGAARRWSGAGGKAAARQGKPGSARRSPRKGKT